MVKDTQDLRELETGEIHTATHTMVITKDETTSIRILASGYKGQVLVITESSETDFIGVKRMPVNLAEELFNIELSVNPDA